MILLMVGGRNGVGQWTLQNPISREFVSSSRQNDGHLNKLCTEYSPGSVIFSKTLQSCHS